MNERFEVWYCGGDDQHLIDAFETRAEAEYFIKCRQDSRDGTFYITEL